MKLKWLGRTLLLGPYLTLCTSEKEFAAVLKHIKCDSKEAWTRCDWDGAKTHFFTDSDGDMTVAVCVPLGDHSDSAIAALMAHEAVHIWRTFCDHIGESKPGEETEAYAIQHLTLVLTDEYLARRAK